MTRELFISLRDATNIASFVLSLSLPLHRSISHPLSYARSANKSIRLFHSCSAQSRRYAKISILSLSLHRHSQSHAFRRRVTRKPLKHVHVKFFKRFVNSPIQRVALLQRRMTDKSKIQSLNVHTKCSSVPRAWYARQRMPYKRRTIVNCKRNWPKSPVKSPRH